MNIQNTKSGKTFYWNSRQNPQTFDYYRVSEKESEKRDSTDIPSEEVSNAIREILENQISLNKMDLVKEAAKLFGFGRVGGNIEATMLSGIEKAVEKGFASYDGERVINI